MLKKCVCLLILLLTLFFTGCTEQKKETITFSSWGSVTETGIIKSLINDFENKNPDIKVNFIHIPQNYFQKLHLLFVAGQEPDVIFINNLYLPLYANKLLDLDNEIKKEDFYSESLDALTFNKKLKAVPRDISELVYYQNLDIINSYPKTLNELFDIAEQLKMNNVWPLSYEPDLYHALPFVITKNPNIKDLQPQSINLGLDLYKNIEGKYAPLKYQVGSSTLAQMFLDKKIAFYLSGRWMYPIISEKADFNWTVIPFPGIASIDASGWAISKNSNHKDAALKFMKYISSESSAEYFTNTGLVVPARIKASQKLNNPKEKAFLTAIKKSKPTPVSKDYRRIADRINKELSE